MNVNSKNNLHNWAVGTRGVRTVQERWNCLSEMAELGGKWALFLFWLQENCVANILCFQDL